LPSVLHLAAVKSTHMPRGSAAPLVTAVHRPIEVPGNAQLRQAPAHSVLQQMPRPPATSVTQCAFKQSSLAAHAWPSRRLPQLPFMHAMPSAQSALVTHLAMHFPFAQRYVPQSCASDAWHVPAPSQVRVVFIIVAPEHVDAAHKVSAGNRAQDPNPSHIPVVPHPDAACVAHSPCGNPAAIGEHVPMRSTWLHDRHSPPHAALQQTPSVQCADAHSVSAAHLAPFIFGPQLPLTHLRPATQSASLTQVGKHMFLVLSQENGEQISIALSRQFRAPSQVKLLVTASASQTPGLHTVPCGWLRHLPAPSQVPSRPHVDLSSALQSVAARAFTPSGIIEHVPSDVAKPHDMHSPPQADSQQNPSAQKPLPHCMAHKQASPLSRSSFVQTVVVMSGGASVDASTFPTIASEPTSLLVPASPLGCAIPAPLHPATAATNRIATRME
jgi:hypothetical protein